MLIFVFIWVLLLFYSWEIANARHSMYVALWWCQLPILTFVSGSEFRFPMHHGNLGVRALPLEFVFRIIWLACLFISLSILSWNDFLE
jgi:hypothetical protein